LKCGIPVPHAFETGQRQNLLTSSPCLIQHPDKNQAGVFFVTKSVLFIRRTVDNSGNGLEKY
jgi:hypothetical protein